MSVSILLLFLCFIGVDAQSGDEEVEEEKEGDEEVGGGGKEDEEEGGQCEEEVECEEMLPLWLRWFGRKPT